MKFKDYETFLFIITFFLYFSSLFSSAIAVFPNHPQSPGELHKIAGFIIFIFGWLEAIDGNRGWIANITFLCSIICVSKMPKFGLLCLALTFYFAAESLSLEKAPGGPDEPDEKVACFGEGFYLWLSSFFTLTILMLSRTYRAIKQKHKTSHEHTSQ